MDIQGSKCKGEGTLVLFSLNTKVLFYYMLLHFYIYMMGLTPKVLSLVSPKLVGLPIILCLKLVYGFGSELWGGLI